MLEINIKIKKILIPTTFGSGSEVTRISVLQFDGIKKSFHNDKNTESKPINTS